MPNQKIDIIEGNISTGKVTLSDGGRTKVGSKWDRDRRKIKWKTETSVVKSFKIVGKTPNVPFESSPPTYYDDKVELRVNKDEPAIEWEYCIQWIDNKGGEHKSDPIISISPSYLHGKDEKIEKLIPLLLAAGFGLFFALKFLNKKRK